MGKSRACSSNKRVTMAAEPQQVVKMIREVGGVSPAGHFQRQR